MLDWIKEHPYLVGGLAVGLVVLYLIWRNASNSSTSSTAATTSSGMPYDPTLAQAQVAAGAQLQGQQIAAQSQQDQLNAQLASQALTTGAQENVQLAQIGAQFENTQTQTTAATVLGLAQLGYQSPLLSVTPINTSPSVPVPAPPVSAVPVTVSQSSVTSQQQNQANADESQISSTISGSTNTNPFLWNPSAPPIQLCNQDTVGAQYACVQQNMANPNYLLNPNAQPYQSPTPATSTSPNLSATINPSQGGGINPAAGIPSTSVTANGAGGGINPNPPGANLLTGRGSANKGPLPSGTLAAPPAVSSRLPAPSIFRLPIGTPTANFASHMDTFAG